MTRSVFQGRYQDMHTFVGKTETLHYNPDMSQVILARAGGDIEIDGQDLFAFVAEYVRQQRISAIEDASVIELLGL